MTLPTISGTRYTVGCKCRLPHSLPSLGFLKSIMRPKLCCVLQRWCRLDMRLVEGGRNFAVHEIWAQFLSFFPYRRLGLHDQHLSVIVMWCLEYEFASYSETVF